MLQSGHVEMPVSFALQMYPRTFPTKEIRNYHVAFTHNAVNGSVFASSQGLLGMGLRTIRQRDRIFVVKRE